MVNVSAECWPLYRLRHLSIFGRYVDHNSADISVDTSIDMSTDISRSTYRPTLDLYVDRYIGQHLADMSTDTSVECRLICRLIYRSRGAQNTHDPRIVPREECCMQKNSRSMAESVSVRCKNLGFSQLQGRNCWSHCSF